MNDPRNHLKRVRALIAKCFFFFHLEDPAGYDSSGEYPELDVQSPTRRLSKWMPRGRK
jgi:hypothetical protein